MSLFLCNYTPLQCGCFFMHCPSSTKTSDLPLFSDGPDSACRFSACRWECCWAQASLCWPHEVLWPCVDSEFKPHSLGMQAKLITTSPDKTGCLFHVTNRLATSRHHFSFPAQRAYWFVPLVRSIVWWVGECLRSLEDQSGAKGYLCSHAMSTCCWNSTFPSSVQS